MGWSINNFFKDVGRDVSSFVNPIVRGGEDFFTGRWNKLPSDVGNIVRGFEAPFNKQNLQTTLETLGLTGAVIGGADTLGLTAAGAEVPSLGGLGDIAGGASSVADLAGTGALGYSPEGGLNAMDVNNLFDPTSTFGRENFPGTSVLDTASLPTPVGTTDIGTPATWTDAGAGGAGGGGGDGGFDLSSYLPSWKTALPYAGLAGLAGLNYYADRKKGGLPQQQNLQNIATEAGSAATANQAYANQLEAPLTTGVLPAGAEQSVVNATNDAITAVKSRYANLGLSGSTQELDAIQAVKDRATAQRFSIAQEMATTGLSAGKLAVSDLGLQGTIYNDLMDAQIKQDQALSDAIARFTGAIGGGLATGIVSKAL